MYIIQMVYNAVRVSVYAVVHPDNAFVKTETETEKTNIHVLCFDIICLLYM